MNSLYATLAAAQEFDSKWQSSSIVNFPNPKESSGIWALDKLKCLAKMDTNTTKCDGNHKGHLLVY